MNTQEIYLYGLIGLRALAEYDPPEYRRSTDMSKREIERQIESLLEKAESSEARSLYDDVKTVIDTSESAIELSFLLQQIYISSFRKAQYYSLQHSRQQSAERPYDLSGDYYEFRDQGEKRISVTHEDELTRLSAMLLLRHLPEYVPSFNHHFKNIKIDCVLEPRLSEMPSIVLEAKSQIANRKQLETSVKQLKSLMTAFGKNTIGGIVLENKSAEVYQDILGQNIYLLLFDVRRNRFINEDFHRLIKRVSE